MRDLANPDLATPAMVTTAEELQSLAETLENRDWFCLDTEFTRENTYFPKLCLIQVAAPGVLALVDPLACTTLEPLTRLLHDPHVLKVLHSARQDLEIFYNLDGQVPAPVFDTQLAAAAAGLGDQLSYRQLVQQLAGTELDKSHTRTNWATRPLSAGQIRYAAEDVYHLCTVFEALRDTLASDGRLAWLQQDLGLLSEPAIYEQPPATAWARIGGHHRMSRRQLAILRELAAWREHQARRSDRPRQWILTNDTLLELAQLESDDPGAIAGVRGLSERQVRRWGDEISRHIRKALALGQDQWPPAPSSQRLPPEGDRVARRIMSAIRDFARERNVTPGYVATRRDVEQVVLGAPAARLLQGWRAEALGDLIRDLRQAGSLDAPAAKAP